MPYEVDYKYNKGTLILVIVAIILLAVCIYGVAKSTCNNIEAQQTIQPDNSVYTVID